MLLLSNQPSEARVIISNPNLLFPLSLTNRFDAHEPLNTQFIAPYSFHLSHHTIGEE